MGSESELSIVNHWLVQRKGVCEGIRSNEPSFRVDNINKDVYKIIYKDFLF